MRNSLMPLVLVVVVVALFVFAMHTESKPGINGPDVYPGIFRLPKKDKFHVDSAVLTIADTVTADGPVPANRGESWRTVLIMAKDRHPLTRATMVALGEVLTGHGCIAIFAPVDAPSFPMGVNRILTIATGTATIPGVLGGEASATLHVTSALARVPVEHPAAALLPHPEGPLAVALTIEHHCAAAEGVAAWSNWWAGEGRGLAGTILAQLAVGGLPPVVDAQTHTWLPGLLPLSDWGSALSMPPTTELLRWEFAFQEHLVRGWVGVVPGMTATTRNGVEEPSLAQLLKRMASGGWEEAGASGLRLFSRKHEDRSEWFSIASRTAGTGWAVAWWQERPGIPDLLSDWGKAAAAGDRGAAGLLHAHRSCPAMPKELQDAANRAVDGPGK